METIDKKFTKLIRKLGCLKKFATEYQAYLVKSKNYLGLGDPDNFWLKQVQSLINEIDLMVFVELWELIKERTLPEDNFGGYVVPSGTFTVNLSRDIKYVINSREPDKVDALIQQIKKVQRRHHVKAEASGKAGEIKNQKPAETGGNATPKSKIKDFLWTLYEKTLKVIVDAVFERWEPK